MAGAARAVAVGSSIMNSNKSRRDQDRIPVERSRVPVRFRSG